jgi:hypothetical protein
MNHVSLPHFEPHLFWNLVGHAHVSLRPGVAKGDVGTLLFILILLPGVLTGRRRARHRLACAGARVTNPNLLRLLQDPFLKISLGIRINLFLGIILLMAAKAA